MKQMDHIDDSILTALGTRTDRNFLYCIEDEFKNLVNTANCGECIVFPTMTSYHRLLIHKVSERYGLYSESNGWGTERQTTVQTTERSNIPCLSFRDFIIYEGTPPEKKKVKFDALGTEAVSTTTEPTNSTSSLPPTNTNQTSSNTPVNPPTNPSSAQSPQPSPLPHTTTTNTPSNPESTAEPNTNTPSEPHVKPPPKRTRTPKAPQPDGAPRVMRGRGTSKFNSQLDTDAEYTSSTSEMIEQGEGESEERMVERDESEEVRIGEEGGSKEGEEGEGKAGMAMDEEDIVPPKQLPLMNDYSKFEYGATNNKNAKNNDAYGFASHEHIVQIETDKDATKESIEKSLLASTKQRFTLKNHQHIYYVIFRSVAAAQALLEKPPQFPSPAYKLSLLTLTSTPKKEEFPDEAIYPRPETTVRVARRLIGNALEMANLKRKL